MANDKNKPATEMPDGFQLPAELASEVAGFEQEQLNFPPYWNPEVGMQFVAMPLTVDDRDKDFVRVVLQAMHPIHCFQGDKENQEDVLVGKDEFFTMSVYAALPLDRYIGYKVHVKVTGKRDVGRPNDMFTWALAVHPDDKKLLNAERRVKAEQAMARYRESRRIEAERQAAQFPPKDKDKEKAAARRGGRGAPAEDQGL